MKELFPIVFFAACLGITAFFATGLVLFLVGRGIFGLIAAFAGNLAATLILVAAFFAVEFLFAVVAAFVPAFSFGSVFPFFSRNLYRNLTAVPVGPV